MLDLAVLGGGRSAEHDVSLRSCSAVLRALDRRRWRPWPVYLAKDGSWHVATAALASGEPVPELGPHLGRAQRPGVALGELLDRGIRVVFPALHGRAGEDGSLQGMLELHDLPFVGSGTAASAVGMDKLRTRECLRAHGVPMAECVTGPLDGADVDREVERIVDALGLPCFVKTDLSGSSFGVERCTDRAGLAAFFGRERGRRYVAERPLRGEEISVPVLGNSGDELEALPPVGIYPQLDDWFTPTAKYASGGALELIPPRGLDAAGIAEVQALAKRCHLALGCDGVSRTDMIVTADGPRVLELNTLPGLTEASLLPKCAAAAGIAFPALLDRLLDAALARGRAPQRRAPRSA